MQLLKMLTILLEDNLTYFVLEKFRYYWKGNNKTLL